ncbi:MAG: UDP-glucose 4-epimerase GalE [Spirochaetales bacterium]|nr:UDP-glucose 4-epimerase GalE [Spirochaetales bacterium]
MSILITGGAGFIGSHTCVELLQAGYEVVVIDNLSNSHEASLDRVRQITGRDLRFYKADVRDEAMLGRIFTENHIECVIHFAGLKAVGESVRMPLEYYENNLNTTLTLVRAMRAFSVKALVFSSSATVYSSTNAMPLTEDVSRTGDCSNPYGWTKYMQEVMLQDIARADESLSFVLLRYFNPVGAHQSGLIGEDPQGIPNNLMPYISQVAVGRLERLSVFGDDYPTPDGTGVRDYIHVVDLARGHLKAVEYALGHRGCEVFNLGTGRPCSVLEMVRAFSEACGKQIPYVIAPRRPGDLPVVYSNPDKARRMLGFETQKDLKDMCADCWRWQSLNPRGFSE